MNKKSSDRGEVVILSNMYPKPYSPQYGIFVKNCVNGLELAGFKIYLGVIAGIGRNVPEKIWKYVRYVIEGTWTVIKRRNATVYVHYVAQSAIPYLIASVFVKRKLIAHIHGGDILQEFESTFYYRIKNWLAQKLCQQADLIIVPSRYFSDVALKVLPLDREKIFISPSGGVDLKIFNPILKHEHCFKRSNVVALGAVGRLDPGKGIETLLHACSRVKQRGVGFTLHIVGEGELAQEFKSLASQLELDDEVTFTGNIPQPQLKQVYSTLDYFIFPTERDTESLGLVGLEALACGTPVIAADIAGPRGYIEHQKNGLLFRCADVADLEEKICHGEQLSVEQYNELSQQAIASSKQFDSEYVNDKLSEKIAQL